jgi:hypothetical protein
MSMPTDFAECISTDQQDEDTEGNIDINGSSDIESEFKVLAAMSQVDMVVCNQLSCFISLVNASADNSIEKI